MTPEAPRRTRLAGERTRLAWWRTALAAFAVGLAAGRGIPALDPDLTSWPYIALGAGFVVYGLILMEFGTRRGLQIDREVESGGDHGKGDASTRILGTLGLILGLGTVLVVLFAG